MKGVELLSSIIALLFMIGITAFLSGVVLFVLGAVRNPSAEKITYEMYLSPIYPPIKYESMLLSYLETTDPDSNFQIKKILVYAAYQKNITNVFIDGREVKTLRKASSNTLSQWLEDNNYRLALNVGGKDYAIAEKPFIPLPDSAVKVRRISIPLYYDAELFKKIKTEKPQELPINITLDFYVL